MNAHRPRRILISILAVIALVALAYGAFRLSKSRSFQLFGRLVTRVETDKKLIALTLDDGPSGRTREILETLRALDIPATFFLCGESIEARPEDARAIVAAGHAVGNHTYSHRRMLLVSVSDCAREVGDTNRLIREAGYAGEIYFRPPYFKRLIALPWYLAREGITTVLADVEPETALGADADARALADYMKEAARPGSIILMHPMYNENALEAIRLAVPELAAEGYSFVTVEQLVREG
jgi:peptidoglycan/xylan/chitin deacetylase (PgdA/CDA1 family)